jgi:2-furoyl-CoA dehydrogenase FAD binding subunit
MKPKAFEYVRAKNVNEVLAILAREGDDAKIIAGGQSLVAMMNIRLVEVKKLIDINHIDELSKIRIDGDAIEVGAAVTQARLMAWPELGRLAPLLAMAFPHIGHYQTRSRGTVCGSIAHSDPSSELPLCLATLGGSVVLRSSSGRRVVPADEFQVGMLATARNSDEMVVAVRFPTARLLTSYCFNEATQRHGDFAVCAVAAIVNDSVIRLGVGGVAEKPTVREWANLAVKDLDDALNQFAWDLGGSDDIHATAQYRRQLVRRLGRQAILEAKKCLK